MSRPAFTAALAVLIIALHTAGRAQGINDPGSQVTALANRMGEMRELLESREAATRDAAVEVALRDPSPAIRGMAIYYALRRYPQLPLQFNLPAGSPMQRESLPSMTLTDVKWDRDGKALSALVRAGGLYRVHGQITADHLRLQFDVIAFTGDLGGSATRRSGREDRPVAYRGCEAELTPATARDNLVGSLQCPGLPPQLPLLLPLG